MADPVIDLNGGAAGTGVTTAYTEGQSAVLVAPSATATDPDSPDFDGGTLTVSFTANADENDRLTVVNGASGIVVGEFQLYYDFGRTDEEGDPLGPELIANYSGGDSSNPLVIAFTSNATPAVVQAVLRSIGYYNISLTMSGSDRSLTWVLSDGDGGTSNSAVATIDVAVIDNPPAIQDDSYAIDENVAIVGGNLFANDFDPDGPPLEISAVNGQSANVGSEITLASGAKLTVRDDGTFDYNPNGAFNGLTDFTSGAVNTSAIETFTYTVAGGGTATATITIAGIVSDDDVYFDDASDNVINGTDTADVFLMVGGGADTANGNGGNDYIYFGATLDTNDHVSGGAGTDTLAVQGNYTLTLGSNQLGGIERLVLYSGTQGGTNFFDYSITTSDSAVAAGATLVVVGRNLVAGEDLIFNGLAETDGRFTIYSGAGSDIIVGGEGADYFNSGASTDQIYGRGGNDILIGGGGGDTLRGGAGYDGFTYLSVDDSNAASPDTIADYQGLDRIDLSAIDANGNPGDGNSAFIFIGSEAFHNVAGELRVTQGQSGWVVEGDVNGDGVADLVINVTVTDGSLLVTSEFVL